MGSADGQGTVEYVALVALLLLALALGGGAIAAPGLANAVAAGWERGLCRLVGGGCATIAARPCVVGSHARDERVTVHAGFIRLGGHAGLVRQDLSDGTVRITAVDDMTAGVQVGLGAEGHVEVGGARVGGGEMAAVGAAGQAGLGRSWVVRDGRAADALIRTLRGPTGNRIADDLLGALGVGDDPPEPEERSFTAGVQGMAEARLDTGLAALHLGMVGTLSAGGRWNRRTGERTVVLRGDGEVTLTLARAFLKGRLRAADRVGAAVTFGRDGHPRELLVSAAGEIDRTLPAALHLGAGRLTARGGRRGEVDARLDLTVPEHLDVLRAAFGAWSAHPLPGTGLAQALPVLARLGGLLADDGRIDARVYASAHGSAGAGADAALGARAGGDYEESSDDLRLLAAWSRPPGGVWEERVDCTRHPS